MDEFDEFKPTTQRAETSNDENVEDDFFGSNFPTNITMPASTNPFNSESKPDISWVMDDDLTDARKSQTNIFDENSVDDRSSTPQRTLYDDDDQLYNDRSNTNELESFPQSNYPPSADELLYQSSDNRPSESNQSFPTFANSISLSSTSDTTESLSPLHAFNARRQQELAEMEAIEKQKIDELRQQGKKELERWYEDRRTQMERKRQSMREEENDSRSRALEKSDKETCDWAKVIRYLDFAQGTQLTKQKRDINRMRAVIIQAKRDKEGRKSENGV